jgi:hypothetical protein
MKTSKQQTFDVNVNVRKGSPKQKSLEPFPEGGNGIRRGNVSRQCVPNRGAYTTPKPDNPLQPDGKLGHRGDQNPGRWRQKRLVVIYES